MIKDFLLFCSGADLGILKQDVCKTEYNKYAGIGSAVFFTALFAFISASYALFTVFNSVEFSLLLGFIWGLFIFSLDRYIVSTLKKENSNYHQNIIINGFFNKVVEIIKASPRIVLAILLGILISKPLELKIFEQEIETELVKMQQKVFKEQEDKVRERYLPNVQRRNEELAKLQSEIDTKKKRYDDLEIIAQQEADGTGGSGKANLGPIYRTKKADADRAYEEYKSVLDKNQPLINDLRGKNSIEDTQLKEETTGLSRNKFDGLLARLTALGSLADNDATADRTVTGVNLLFIFFELVPLLFKILTDKGIYDIKLQMLEEKINSEEIEKISQLNDEINRRIKIKVAENQNIVDREREDNQALMQLISDAQLSIAEEIIKHWKDGELQKIKENPNQYTGNLDES
jgi:hypothetical protein